MDPKIAEKVEKFFSEFPVRSINKGQILVHAGENPTSIMYLAEGRVRQYDITYKGDEMVINIYKPSTFFPMSWALNGGTNKYFFEAMGDVKIRHAPPESVVNFLKDNPEIMLDLLSRLYKGVDGLLGQMVQLMGASARSRLIYEIILESERFGQKLPDGSHKLKITENELASRSGMTRETVSRQISSLKEQNIVKLSRGGIVIKDLEQLKNKLE